MTKNKNKEQTCRTCKWLTGTKCRKNDEFVNINDWCSAYKRKKEETA